MMRPGTPMFVGERLREAREARGMTAVALADVLGVSRAAISQYENGHQTPAPDVMREISRVLNLPVQRFLKQFFSRDRGTIFYRSMSSATKRARSRAERRYEWLREICNFLERYIRFPEVNYPDFDLTEDAARLGDDTIEERATEARRFWGLGDGPISNVTWLLENKGTVVCRTELEADTLDAFSEWRMDDTRPFIILSAAKESTARSRFDAAHELGHMLLHRRLNADSLKQQFSFKLIEHQANRFASSFLLPASTFGTEVRSCTLDAFRSLKERWGVSIAAMIMRAHQLQVISDEQSKRLWMNLSRRKWRTREPLDDITEPEQPRYLRRCFEHLVDQRIISTQEVPFQLGISSHDVESLLGLPNGRLKVDQPVDQTMDVHGEREYDREEIYRFPTVQH